MNNLYPLRFKPFLFQKVWGGENLVKTLNKKTILNKIGESWEISDFQNYISVVENGFLESKNLKYIINLYKGEIIGYKIYERFGNNFPLLIKFIDTNEYLSIQVHPDDYFALKNHNESGKTEMWYIIDSKKDAQLISGFKNSLTKDIFLNNINENKITEIINFEKSLAEDVFFIPAGCLHGIGPGILLAEIQQSSDLTYRVYDWDRNGLDGKPRELHTDLALEVINLDATISAKTNYKKVINSKSEIIYTKFFTTNILWFDNFLELDYKNIDSFVIYICVYGSCVLKTSNNKDEIINLGDTILLPASLKNICLTTDNSCKILEVYINL